MLIREFGGGDFETEVESGQVLVDFWAPWCGPCKHQSKVLEGMTDVDVSVLKVDIDDHPEVAEGHSVMSVPTMILYQNGIDVQRFIGLTQEAELRCVLG